MVASQSPPDAESRLYSAFRNMESGLGTQTSGSPGAVQAGRPFRPGLDIRSLGGCSRDECVTGASQCAAVYRCGSRSIDRTGRVAWSAGSAAPVFSARCTLCVPCEARRGVACQRLLALCRSRPKSVALPARCPCGRIRTDKSEGQVLAPSTAMFPWRRWRIQPCISISLCWTHCVLDAVANGRLPKGYRRTV
jgi:hypothetical protein